MSATGNLSTPQFGSVSAGTYDAAAHTDWHDQHTTPVRRSQLREMNNRRAATFNAIGDARRAGQTGLARIRLSQARNARHTVESWTPRLSR